MCINPSYVWQCIGSEWRKQPTACRQCWRCKKNRINDYVGRCLAEAATSLHVCAITLTYAPRDDLADKVLNPRHFQLFMKLLRRAGHKVRYLVAGEYGDLKGRSHFHALLFFTEMQPGDKPVVYNWGHLADPSTSGRFCRQIPNMDMVHIREWPHGHVKVDWSADEKAVRYVCHYIFSDDKNNGWFSLSKKPALGAEWFARKAKLAREFGVLPSSFNYLPPGASRDKRYLATGATRRDYLNAITQDSADLPRMSEWVAKTFEKHARKRLLDELESQSPEELEAAAEKRKEVLDEQANTIRRLRYWRQVDDYRDKIIQSGGVLRRHRGEWIPERDMKNEP